MGGEIINRVDSAGLITLDLRDFIVPGERISLDLANWLDNELIIKEASFKKKLEENNTIIKKKEKINLELDDEIIWDRDFLMKLEILSIPEYSITLKPNSDSMNLTKFFFSL